MLPVPIPELMVSLGINAIPILILVIMNYIIVWNIPHIKNVYLGYIINLTFSMTILVILNIAFQLCVGRGVEWAGTIFSNILIFIGMEAIYHQNISKLVLQQHALTKQQILQYQYEVLKAQVNPHFLFNSLNILYSFIPPEAEKAREYVLNLSYVYRYTINHGDKNQVRVKDEVKFLNAYSEILKIRYHNNFQVQIIGIEEYEDKQIIPYSLQLLVENVIKHNTISSALPMIVSIYADPKGITVYNPIHRKETEVETHFGLQYLKRLYESYNQRIEITNDNKLYKAFIPYIPSL